MSATMQGVFKMSKNFSSSLMSIRLIFNYGLCYIAKNLMIYKRTFKPKYIYLCISVANIGTKINTSQ